MEDDFDIYEDLHKFEEDEKQKIVSKFFFAKFLICIFKSYA